MPASGWYEWTGPPRRKRRWRIRAPGCSILAFAAVWNRWRAPGRAEIRSLTTVTCAPNPQVAAVHDRMPAIIDPAGWPGETEADPAALLRPLPAGRLEVTPDQAPGGP